MAKLMNIRRADTCADCGMPLAEGAQAFWDAIARIVRCVACGSSEVAARYAPMDTDTRPTADVPPSVPMLDGVIEPGPVERGGDVAGGSAKKEYEK